MWKLTHRGFFPFTQFHCRWYYKWKCQSSIWFHNWASFERPSAGQNLQVLGWVCKEGEETGARWPQRCSLSSFLYAMASALSGLSDSVSVVASLDTQFLEPTLANISQGSSTSFSFQLQFWNGSWLLVTLVLHSFLSSIHKLWLMTKTSFTDLSVFIHTIMNKPSLCQALYQMLLECTLKRKYIWTPSKYTKIL